MGVFVWAGTKLVSTDVAVISTTSFVVTSPEGHTSGALDP
jgi:hypothetical protein